MSGPYDFIGPGEDATPDGVEAEAHVGPIPEGEMPGHAPDRRRQTLELHAVDPCEADDCPEAGEHRLIYRTGTDRDGIEPVKAASGETTETRQDHSAVDTQREAVFDPAQDDTGPQSDQA